ncbi:unnamed protein product [Microthlaspi erraticum]|uniref:Response regulatory domain-containing protein n=1 Tax=Microthlaspi erraticum TaxID=1685480 RepID=A0A6D2K8N9_9BRAS|nr:unnamed protein product [Microthlaspi erraticum]
MLAGNPSRGEDKTRSLQQKTSEFNSLLNGIPASTNILLVDTNFVTLFDMRDIMQQYAYEVTIFTEADEAIAFLTNCEHEINIVIWDFNMPGINGLQALDIIGSRLDLPVVITADDDPVESVMQATLHGACDYLVKPVKSSIIANIWQHIVRKKMMRKPGLVPPVQSEDKGGQNIGEAEENAAKKPRMASASEETQPLPSDPVPSNGLDKDNDNSKTIKQGNGEKDKVNPKKPRTVWDNDLQEKFLEAIDVAGGSEKANPKEILKILKEMKVEGLTGNNVASHLQKYRQSLAEVKAPAQPVQEAPWVPLGVYDTLVKSSSIKINDDQVQQDQYRNNVQTTSLLNGFTIQPNQYPNNFLTTTSLLNGFTVQPNQYPNSIHTTTSSLMNGGLSSVQTATSSLVNGDKVQQNQYLNKVHAATSSLVNGDTVQQSKYRSSVQRATSSLVNVQQNQHLSSVHTATSSLVNGDTVQQNQYLNKVHTATSMNGETVQHQYLNNVHTATSSLVNTDPIQQNQYRNGYSTVNNNNDNQFMTNPLPRLPYLDHPHLQPQQPQQESQQEPQQQQPQQEPQQQHDQQLPLSHEWNYVTSNYEPEEDYSATEPELIYTNSTYDLGEYFPNGYNFPQ